MPLIFERLDLELPVPLVSSHPPSPAAPLQWHEDYEIESGNVLVDKGPRGAAGEVVV